MTVSLPVQRAQKVTVQLFNAAGRKVKETHVRLNNGNNLFMINDLQILPAGIYLLKASVDGNMVTAKIAVGRL